MLRDQSKHHCATARLEQSRPPRPTAPFVSANHLRAVLGRFSPHSPKQPGEAETSRVGGTPLLSAVGLLFQSLLSPPLECNPKVNHLLESLEIILSTTHNMYGWNKLLFISGSKGKIGKTSHFCGYYQGLERVAWWPLQFHLLWSGVACPPAQDEKGCSDPSWPAAVGACCQGRLAPSHHPQGLDSLGRREEGLQGCFSFSLW